MRRTNIYLDESQTAALDDLARAEGISRAAVIRRLVDRGLNAATADLDADLSAIESTFGILGETIGHTEFLGRDADDRASHLERIRQQ